MVSFACLGLVFRQVGCVTGGAYRPQKSLGFITVYVMKPKRLIFGYTIQVQERDGRPRPVLLLV